MSKYESELLRIIDALYASAAGETTWHDPISKIQQTFKAATAQIFTTSSNANLKLATNLSVHNPDTHGHYSEDVFTDKWQGLDIAFDPRFANGMKRSEGEVYFDHQYITDSGMHQNAFYQDFLRPFDLRTHLGANLLASNGTFVSLAAVFDVKNGHPTEEQIAAFQTIIPHAMRAVRMQDALSFSQSERQTVVSLLDRTHIGIALVNSSGEIMEMNQTLSEFLKRNDGLHLYNRKLAASLSSNQKGIDELIGSAVAPVVLGAAYELKGAFVERPCGLRPYIINAIPIRQSGINSTRAVAAAIAVTDLEIQPLPKSSLVQTYFGLTPTEGIVAVDLLSGKSIADIADARAVAKSTVQSQVKAVLQKTNTNSQGEFIRLLNRFPAFREEENP